MFVLSAQNVNEAAYETLIELNSSNAVRYKSDKGEVKALENVMIDIPFNNNRWLTLPGRNNSLVATIAEIMWVMSGDNEITQWLNLFLKRAPNYSDNGSTWRAGYGKRLYNYDQIQDVIDRLIKSPFTRQACISIYDPSEDSLNGIRKYNESIHKTENMYDTLDMPCNNILYFSVSQEKKLNLHITARGLDWTWGTWSINYQEFRILQECLAKILGYEVGNYNLYCNNLHYYTEVPVVQSQVKTILEGGTWKYGEDRPYYSTFDIGSIKSSYELKGLFNRLCKELKRGGNYRYILRGYNITPGTELYEWCNIMEAVIANQKDPNNKDFKLTINNRPLREALERDKFYSWLLK